MQKYESYYNDNYVLTGWDLVKIKHLLTNNISCTINDLFSEGLNYDEYDQNLYIQFNNGENRIVLTFADDFKWSKTKLVKWIQDIINLEQNLIKIDDQLVEKLKFNYSTNSKELSFTINDKKIALVIKDNNINNATIWKTLVRLLKFELSIIEINDKYKNLLPKTIIVENNSLNFVFDDHIVMQQNRILVVNELLTKMENQRSLKINYTPVMTIDFNTFNFKNDFEDFCETYFSEKELMLGSESILGKIAQTAQTITGLTHDLNTFNNNVFKFVENKAKKTEISFNISQIIKTNKIVIRITYNEQNETIIINDHRNFNNEELLSSLKQIYLDLVTKETKRTI